jgi:hypothetical protein
MNPIRTTMTVALAAVVLIGTGAAAGTVAASPGPGAAPDDAGPPSDLPEPVPDFVGDILGSVNDSLSGAVDDLGATVSGIAGDAGEASDRVAEGGV